MSADIDSVESQGKQSVSDDNQAGSTDKVDYETYKRTVSREKALKAQLAEAQAKAKEFDDWKAQQEEQKMMEEKKYKELLTKRDEEIKKEREARSNLQNQMVSSLKRQALERELGGVKRPEYLSFADLASIELGEDGQIVIESLKSVADAFRNTHADLIKGSSDALPSGAPKAAFQGEAQKELTYKEMLELHQSGR
jgi:hypothetical protein